MPLLRVSRIAETEPVREVQIRLEGTALGKDAMRVLAAILDRHAGDRPVSFVMDLNGRGPHVRVWAGTARRIRPSDQFVRDVESVCGSGSVMLK